jgi:hypothetical protein
MSETVSIDYLLTVNVESATTTLNQLQHLGIMLCRLLNRLGLPEDVKQAVASLMRLIQIIRLARISLLLLQTAEGPIGWATAGLSVASGALIAGETAMEFLP